LHEQHAVGSNHSGIVDGAAVGFYAVGSLKRTCRVESEDRLAAFGVEHLDEAVVGALHHGAINQQRSRRHAEVGAAAADFLLAVAAAVRLMQILPHEIAGVDIEGVQTGRHLVCRGAGAHVVGSE